MRKTTYTVKEIAEFTGLSEAKIRSFINSGSLKGERVKAVNDAGRNVTRLEVAEEDLAAFALTNYELVGPLLDMDFMNKYMNKSSIVNSENGNPAGDSVEVENGDPASDITVEDTGVSSDDNWEDPAEADFDTNSGGNGMQQSNEEMDVANENLSNSPSENTADKKEKMLLELRELVGALEDDLAVFEGNLAYGKDIVEAATSAINWTRGKIDNLNMVINHISENM